MMPEEEKSCAEILNMLVAEGIVHQLDGYYSLSEDPDCIKSRIAGNKRADRWMKKARNFSRLIAHFPYVRGVSVSGSLSKGFLGDDPDIDYFIITKPGRLWLARTMLVVFKKIFLLNSYRYFCINYFIDSENLEIEEKNLFTATEIITMIPMFGNGIKDEFYNSNNWINSYYPNYTRKSLYDTGDSKKGILKRSIEFLLNARFGDWLDKTFMNITISHWRKKFQNRFTEEEFQLIFKSDRKISKHHPQNFQMKVRTEFEIRKKKLAKENKLDLGKVVFQLEHNT
jgi:hypothetical protein